ncbi:hypothetical protein RHGRI_017455 [Rhododendron griersonianum]|uniref:Uncharacterized protein n=1 Tax=Rhododendron griersonianum TaxID=479676 RepID=A0AAV6JY56_9ERIC|nr:hypothetical protein RHGRI_017455 [Rhododendron griersonianum]
MGGGDEENNVHYSGDSYEEMSKSVSQGDTESESDGETDGQSESGCHSGAIKLPHLASFASRPVIEEMSGTWEVEENNSRSRTSHRFGVTSNLQV